MSDPRPARAVVVGIDGSRAATHAALWAVDEAVNRDIPLRLVYVIDPSQLSAAGEGGGQSAARAALHDASRKVEATGQPVKIETEVLCGRPLTKLMQESRSAAMLCVGSVGLDHVRGRRGSVAATLAGSALCPVAVIHPSPAEPATTSRSARLSRRWTMVWCCGTHSRRPGCAEFRCGPWLSTLLKHPMTSNRAAGWRMYT